MTTSRLFAGASGFAHFAGLSRKVRGSADEEQRDDEPKGKRSRASEDEDDQDDMRGKKSKRADDDQCDDDEPKGKRSRASDDDDDDEDDQDKRKSKKSKRASDDDDDGQEEPKGKRSRASDDDDYAEEDDDKEEMNGRSAKASARRREQARIGAILGHAAAANNLPLAMSLACETRMTRLEAITVLRGQGGQRHDRDDLGNSRHARQDRSSRNVQLGSDSHASVGPQAVSRGWDAAFQRAGIKSTPR